MDTAGDYAEPRGAGDDDLPGGGSVGAIPEELRALRQWVVWRLEAVEGRPKPTKVPYTPGTTTHASSTDKSTWRTFPEALEAFRGAGWSGIGFVFTPDDPYCGVDFDDIIDPETGEMDAGASEDIDRFATYTEMSQSGRGAHLILRGSPPNGEGRNHLDRECYDRGRFFVVTGRRTSSHGIEARQTELDTWHARTFPAAPSKNGKEQTKRPRAKLALSDDQLRAKIAASGQGAKFTRLWDGDISAYGSASEADLALCSILAGWCQKDADRVDRMFRASGLCRSKWDTRRRETTYGRMTVDKAVSSVTWQYDPEYRSGATAHIGTQEDKNGAGEEPPEATSPDDIAGIDDLKRAGAEVKWVWPGWIQRNVVTAIAAQGGTGKTRLMADLVRRVRHQLPWPDGTPMTVQPGPCVALWVVSDNHHDEMVTLCEAFGIADCVKVNAAKSDPYGGVTLEDKSEFDALQSRVRIVKPVFVVVDTVGNATDKNLSKQEDSKAFYQPLQLIARKQQTSVMALTHLNAAGGILGRRALEKVRVCVRMSAASVKERDCPRRVEVFKSNSLIPDPLGMFLQAEGSEFNNSPPPPPEDGPAGAPTPKIGTKTEACKVWLEGVIKERPYKLTDLRTLAGKLGFDSKSLYAAKALLELEETTSQNYKWWRFKVDA